MDDVTLFGAWSAWLGGQEPSECQLWGISLLWWGRIGKILQAFGALTVLAEIIGSERIRAFGQSLHGAVTFEGVRRWFSTAVGLARDSLTYLKSGKGSDREALAQVLNSPLALLDGILAVAIGASATYLISEIGLPARVFVGILVWMFSYVLISPFLAAVLIMSVLFLGLCMDLFVIEPFAWLVERPSIDRLIKLVGVALLLIGFHFDLLAS
jgi:hypothetical protein